MESRDYLNSGYVIPGYIIGPRKVSDAFDPSETIISQYANSPTLLQLIDCMSQYFDPSTDLNHSMMRCGTSTPQLGSVLIYGGKS
jgi:hypothetical protein